MSVKVHGVFKAAKERRQVPAGTVIFEAGSVGEEMFGVVDGKVELRIPTGRVVALVKGIPHHPFRHRAPL